MADKNFIVKNGLTVNTGFSVNSTAIYWSNVFSLNSTSYSGTSTYSNGSSTNTFTVGTGTYFVSNGNVGIGNSSPAYPLEIESGSAISPTGLRIKASTHATSRRSALALDTWYLLQDGNANGTKDFGIYDSNTPAFRFYINTGGNVGIGTTSPSSKLHVYSTTLTEIKSEINSSSGNVARLKLKSPVCDYAFLVSDNTNGFALYDYNASAYRMYVDASGNVGIGTSSPVAKLDVNGGIKMSSPYSFHMVAASASTNYKIWDILADNTTNNTLYFRAVNDSYTAAVSWLTVDRTGYAPGNIVFYNGTNLERMRIASTGYVGIGTSSPNASLDVNGYIYSSSTGDDLRRIKIKNNQRDWSISVYNTVVGAGGAGSGVFAIADESAATVRAIIDLSGNLLLNAITNSSVTGGRFFIAEGGGNACASLHNTAQNSFGLAVQIQYTNSYFAWFNFGSSTVGSIATDGSSTSYNTTSDYRIKEHVGPIENPIERVKLLHPVGFNYIANPAKRFDGFIAHEVQSVVPTAVTGEKDALNADGTAKLQQMDASKLIPLLTAALQKALEKIDNLESRIVELEK